VSWPRRHRLAVILGVVVVVVFGAVAVAVGRGWMRPTAGGQRGTAAADGGPGSAGSTANDSPGASAGPSTTAGPSASASAKPNAGPTRTAGAAAGPPARTGFPGSGNTGVPAGVGLSGYAGSCTITTANAVIEGKTLNCGVEVRAKNVQIRKSKIVGGLGTANGGSVTLEDSEVDAGTQMIAAVGGTNVTVRRANIHGGETSVNCDASCVIEDSWLHGLYIPPNGNWHLDAYLSNGTDHITLRHNTFQCDTPPTPNDGGCSADAALFGDFAANSYVTFDHNLFVASRNAAYCFYGGSNPRKGHEADHIVVVNNVFQRGATGHCGDFGAVTDFSTSRPGNQWSNNTWDDGSPIGPG
jgi:hypothetical protein